MLGTTVRQTVSLFFLLSVTGPEVEDVSGHVLVQHVDFSSGMLSY